MSPVPVLVTGGRGYLGHLVVQRLLAHGIPVVSLDRRASVSSQPGAVDLVADLREIDLAEVFRQHAIGQVVHLAAIVEPPRGMTEEELEDIEVGGTRRVIEACVATGVEHVTVASSGAAYGYLGRNDGRLLDEDTPTPGSAEFAYSRHKAAVEAMVARTRRLHPQLGLLLLRPGTILGAGTDNQITALFTSRVLMALRESEGPFTFVWDQDVADIVVAGVQRRRTGVYNVAGDGVLTIREIARIEGRPVVAVPAGLVRTSLRIARRLGLGRYGPEQVDFLRHRPVLDNARLRRDFPGLPTKTTREVYEIFRTGRSTQRTHRGMP